MKKLLAILALSAVTHAWAAPSLILIDRNDLKRVENHVTVVREHGSQLFIAVDLAFVPADAAYKVLDTKYTEGQYLLVRGPSQAARLDLPILWQDAAGALVKLPVPLNESLEAIPGSEPLEKQVPVTRESRPPSHLDDPALDAWLTDLAAQVDADSLFGFVSTLASWNRYSRWLSNDTAATWIRSKFQSYGLDSAYFHPFTVNGSGWSRTAQNVIGVQVGSVYPDSIVLIGGHMDATSQSPATGAPGAEDNASGTAAVIEAARLLSQHIFTRTLMYVAFNGEEQGLQGSEALANQMAGAGRDIIAVINMDMIGYLDPAGADLWIEGFYSGTNSVWLMDVIEDNCLQFTDLVPYRYPSDGWGSDHASFHDAGYPAILSIENEYDTYPCYHQLCDLPNYITPTFHRQMAVVNVVSGAELALPLGTGSISGHVTLENEQNFSNVLVRNVAGEQWTQSNAAGFYRLTDLLAGDYDLAFSRSGWISDTLIAINVADNQETANQNIALLAASPGSISGTISVSGGGGNVTDAIVYAGSVVADVADDGTYSLSPLYGGQHVITVALDNYSLRSSVVTLADGQQMTGVNLTLYPLWDFESSNFNFNNNGSGWGWGTDAIAGYHSATHVWGTVLGGNYVNCGNYPLDTPPFSLSYLDSARLTFWHWYDIEPSGPSVDYDGANVKIAHFGLNDWQVIEPIGGYPQGAGYVCNPIQGEPAYNGISGSWFQAIFDLTPYLNQTIQLRFHLGSDQGVTRRGWYIDDFALLSWHSFVPSAPDSVTDLTVHPTGNNIILRWSPSIGALNYLIYRSEVSDQPIENWTLLATQPGTMYIDADAANLPTAFYLVIATN